ncbi:MAG: IS1634 family transposase [Candidatus Electrothrix sp. Rat3]|nr:IS1634 family transposase [Candidatus Electrothrix rattekaaiensis]MDU9050592.1 IS1634 family transposase [Candidatus Electrothrix rattekaaiensis]
MEELQVITERVDDIPLLIGTMTQIGLVEILDSHTPTHWKQRALSWGWTAVIWLSYILSEGDHRKSSVEQYISRMQDTLENLTGQKICEADFATHRLAVLLRHLSQEAYWAEIEKDLSKRSIEVHELPTKVVRCDATTVSGYHEGSETGLLQFGHSKDDASLRQIKVMTGALDPLGMPLATDVVSGEKADDPLYLPVIERVHNALQKTGVLYCGDCKMSSLETRTYIRSLYNHYLSPLPLTGKIAKEMETWIEGGLARKTDGELEQVFRENDKGEEVLIAEGYELDRNQSGVYEGKEFQWNERILILHSPAHAAKQERGLEQRLEKAQLKLNALTPPRGRGKRQITEESVLQEKIDKILKAHKVEGLLTVEYEKQVEEHTKYVGRGRGSKKRPQQVIRKIRYQIKDISRKEEQVTAKKDTFGWKAFVTDVDQQDLSLQDAVLCYRKEYRVERIFERLKSRLNIAPLFVQRDDQVAGLTHLLALGIRVLTLIEFVVRRSLKQDQAVLEGMYPGQPKKRTAFPTVERVLQSFSNISLSIIHSGEQVIRHLTPLSDLQKDLLRRLGIGLELYQNLENKSNGILLTNR